MCDDHAGLFAPVLGQLVGGQGQGADVGERVGAALAGGAVIVGVGGAAQGFHRGVDDCGGFRAEDAGQAGAAGAIGGQGEKPVPGGAFLRPSNRLRSCSLGRLRVGLAQVVIGGRFQPVSVEGGGQLKQCVLHPGFDLRAGSASSVTHRPITAACASLTVPAAQRCRGGRAGGVVQHGGGRLHFAGHAGVTRNTPLSQEVSEVQPS